MFEVVVVRELDKAANHDAAKAVLTLAAAFHDIGKASRMFQDKLRAASAAGSGISDAVRHELISAAVWDSLFGALSDEELKSGVNALTPTAVDNAWRGAARRCDAFHNQPTRAIGAKLDFLDKGGSLTRAIGLLILTHHRLPGSGTTDLDATQHVRDDLPSSKTLLAPASGQPFWHEASWLEKVHAAGMSLAPQPIGMFDLILRTCLQTADHLGSARKTLSSDCPDHLANLIDGKWADSLANHTAKVMSAAQGSYDALVTCRDAWPAIAREAAPSSMIDHSGSKSRFSWQADAAGAAAQVAASGGGFFACVMAGTGTGKTRGVPAILAAAAFADPDERRQRLRFCLGLGLRTLATQSARAYIEDLGFHPRDVTVVLGQAPVEVPKARKTESEDDAPNGSADLAEAMASTRILTGDEISDTAGEDDDRLRRLTWSPEDDLHPFIREMMEKAGHSARERFFASPVLIGTIDQLAPSIMPTRSRHLPASIRVMTSDLIIDEIDQLGAEDVAALCRLIRQAGASGRRVIIASATIPCEIAEAAFKSYKTGWAEHAAFAGAPDHVSALFTGDHPGAIVAEATCTDPAQAYRRCAALQSLAPDHPGRMTAVLDLPSGSGRWDGACRAISESCDTLHECHAAEIEGLQVSMGFIRLSRISHAVGMAHQLCRLPVSPGIHRRVICLHSRMTGAMRGFIETEMRAALNRKGDRPDGGLRNFIRRHGIDFDARAEGAAGISIIVVCTPVIETGNDVDFDWAILDPSDARSVIQAAGRVMRHRSGRVTRPNILLLSRPLVVAETGRLQMPGLETPLRNVPDVSSPVLGEIRESSRLLLGELCRRISARPILLREPGTCPAADMEAALRESFFGSRYPLESFNEDPVFRMGLGRLEQRQFRRRERPDTVIIRDEDTGQWHVDEWTRFGRAAVAVSRGDPAPARAVFSDPEDQARRRYEDAGELTPRALSIASVPLSKDDITARAELRDDPFLGLLLKGQDPASPFGKAGA